MQKYKIELVTNSDINDFVKIVSKVEGEIKLIDDTGLCVNAKSLLGVLYTIEWDNLYCISEHDIYSKIEKYIK